MTFGIAVHRHQPHTREADPMPEAPEPHDSGKAPTVTLASARSAHYRALERRQVRRLVEATPFDTSHMVGVSDMMRLKAAYHDLWTRIFVATRPPQQGELPRLRRDRMRLNNRVHRQRQRQFIAEVEKRLVAEGRVLPEAEYTRSRAPTSMPEPTTPSFAPIVTVDRDMQASRVI